MNTQIFIHFYIKKILILKSQEVLKSNWLSFLVNSSPTYLVGYRARIIGKKFYLGEFLWATKPIQELQDINPKKDTATNSRRNKPKDNIASNWLLYMLCIYKFTCKKSYYQ